MNNKESNKLAGISIHILIWIGLFSLPHLISFFTNTKAPDFDVRALIMPIQIMGMFYLNYLFLINKLLFRKRVWQFITCNLLIVISVSIIVMIIMHSFPPDNAKHIDHERDKIERILPIIANLLIQTLVIGLSVSIKMTNKWYEVRQRLQELEKANTEAELQQLKSQLNPHFLFNSLNNIYALISFNPEKAQLSLNSLCDMLRYQLYEANRETIPLEKEIEFVRSYCDLMRLRLPKHVALDINLTKDTTGITIAPLLFVSIVENAFKHGISQNNTSYINITISVENRQHIICIVRNSYYPKKDNDRSGSGIGIENLCRRLELLYPESHSFKTEKIRDEFVAQLTIKVVPNI